MRAYHGYVWDVAFRITQNREDAEDLCQDVFLKLLLDPPPAESVRSPAGFLAWRVLGRARSLKRSADKRKRREEAHASRELETPEAADELEALHEAIGDLPADLRMAVELRCLARLSLQDVAQALEISDRAVQSRIEKARGLIKRRLARCAPGAALLGLESAGNAAPAPPVGLLPVLLKIVERGSALAPAAAGSGIIAIGAFIMAKKVLVAVGLAVIVFLGVGGGLLWRSRSPREDKAPREPLAEPAVVDAGAGDSPQQEASTLADSGPRSAALLPPYAELRGVVLHESGAPLAGARVRYVDSIRPEDVKDLTERGYPDVREGEVSLETVSNGGGEFAFSGLFPGGGRVSAERESVFMQGMVKVEMKAGEVSWKELRLQDLLRVTGSIRDREGAALVGSLVFLQAHQIQDPPMKLGSIDYVEFGGFPADANGGYDSGFRLTIQKGHHAALFAWAQGCAIATRGIQLSEFAGLEARVDFELLPELPVSVLVTTRDGKPIEGAEVGLGKEDGIFSSDFPYPAAFTDSRGRARLEHLAPREQPIRAAMEGYHAASINVGPGGPEVFHITLQPLGHPITGRVVFEGDSRLPRQAVDVSLVHMNGEEASMRLRAFNETSDREGLVYTYRPREPGRYRFEYRHGDDDYPTEPFDYTGAEPMDVKLPVELKLRPPYVSGIVLRSESGEPLPDAVVEAHHFPRGKEPSRWGGGAYIHLGHQRNHFFPPPPGRVSEARSGADGRFLIPLPREGGSTVILQARSSAVWWHGPENEKLWWSEEVVLDVAETDSISDVRIEVNDGGSIEGLVLDGGGDPQAGEVVAVYSGAVVTCRTSNAEGRFRFGRLSAGTYAIEPLGTTSSLRVGGGGWGQDVDLPRPEDFFERKVLVENGKAAQLAIDLARERLGILEGTVADDLVSGSGVHFGMVLGGRPRQGTPFGGDRELTGRTFRIEGLHPGVYRVWVRDGGELGQTLAAAEVDVRRGQTSRVALVPPSSILSVPLPGLEDALKEKVQVVKVRRLSHVDASGKMFWEPLGGFEVEWEPESLRIEKLLAGSVKVALYAPGFREAWTEAVPVREGALSISSPLRFERGSRIVVHVEGSDKAPVLDGLRIRVFREDEGEVACTVERVSGQPAWVLSSFGEGEHNVNAFLEERSAGFVTVQVPADQDVEATLRLEGSE